MDNRVRVWRPRDERFNNRYVLQQDAWPAQSVMLWGAFIGNRMLGPVFFDLQLGRGGGVTSQRYINQVLQPLVVPLFARRRRCLFQQDNAPAHSARATQQFLRQTNIPVMEWPAKSPDLNPMEQVWAFWKTRINRLPNRPACAAEFRQELRRQWGRVPPAFLNRQVNSMPNRCQLVIRNAGATPATDRAMIWLM
nr:hypothetical protein BaRGS_029906 [Batillaria attramentaria]